MDDTARTLGMEALASLRSGDRARAMKLIDEGADVNARDGRLDSVLLYAGAHGMDDVVRAALGAGGDLAITNRFGGIALIPASERGHVSTVRLLIDAGSNLDHVNNLGWTALHEAIVLGDGGARHLEIVRMLLDAGADPRLPDGDGVPPRELARRAGYAQIVTALDLALARE